MEQGITKVDRQECLSYSCAKVLALLAALVSASLFSVLFCLAGTVCNAVAERFHAVRLSHLLHVSAGARWRLVLSAGLARLLVGDDVFGRGLCDRVLHCDCFSD